MQQLQHQNSTLEDTSRQAAPAATARSFLSGIIQHYLPARTAWLDAIKEDKETSMIKDEIENPQTVAKQNLNKTHFYYRQPIRDGANTIEDEMLFMKEKADITGNYIKLQIVPRKLRNAIFIAFHSNPIGGHLDTYHTFHRIRLRYFWPQMHRYVKHAIYQCQGCRIARPR